MRTSPTTVDDYRRLAMVETMLRDGRTEQEIVAAVEEADGRASVPARQARRRWRSRLIRATRSR